MVTISCSGKLHAFALAEQMERHRLLDEFDTTYASFKNTFLHRYVKRTDKESIPVQKIQTNTVLAFPAKLWQTKSHVWNQFFDEWVARRLKKSLSKVFIGWSGMSLVSMGVAKKKGMLTILERGSSHIEVQDRILQEEYKKFGQPFSVHPAVIEKELKEYEAADYISVPSFFVRDSFVEQGVSADKLFLNPYGVSSFFTTGDMAAGQTGQKIFRIVYVGGISVRKGLIYLFRALASLSIPSSMYEVWFLGTIEPLMQEKIREYQQPNWKFWGQIDHYELPTYLRQCDLGVQPSLEEGLSMVIPQMMSCGLPVIASTNSGGANMITDTVDGFIVPIRDPKAIAEKIEWLFAHTDFLHIMQKKAGASISEQFTWNKYGDRYSQFIKTVISSEGKA